MVHAQRYYLLKLNPPPRSVRIMNRTFANDHVWDCAGTDPCRIEIAYLQAGTIHEDASGVKTVFDAGTAYVTLLGHKLHHELKAPAQEQAMWLFFWEPPLLMTAEEVASRQIAIHEAIVPGLLEDPIAAKQLGDMILAAKVAAPRGDALRSLKLRTHMYDILTMLTQSSIDQARRQLQLQRQEWSRRTKRAIDYIQKHLSERLTVEDIAAGAGSNYDHLKMVFRRDVGMTIVEYTNYLRVQKVKELISVRKASFESIGDAVGVGDIKYLGRLFRRYTGMTMTEYRNICRESQEL